MFQCEDLFFTGIVYLEQLRKTRQAAVFVINHIVTAKHRSTPCGLR